MTACRHCDSPLPDDGRFCPACGAAQEPSSATATRAVPVHAASTPGLRSSSGSSDSRFIPGAIVAGRYRVLSLLGKGGMGEVYRADDLKLGQPVALKFLPEALGAQASKLDRFFNEVRTARQVSHPNVCRVYDIGEVDGHHYLSMEYIDGEDLASLLRRIGRLPGDKAVEIARQLCAGVAAAHDKGVLHRDLKPANVMIDGRGRARITDFGLAGLASEIQGVEIRSGTPAYMAPEQLAGKEVSVRSDIYALGLVLYEIFTGKPAFDAPSLDALMKLHQTSDVASPSSITRDLDPTVERVILRCLEKDPANRPPSALAVAAALPGGDPLAAALAAGETPSPEMVAAAGEDGALRPAAAAGLLAVFILLLVAEALLAPKTALLSMAPAVKPPEVLAEKAREILALAGHSGEAADEARGYIFRNDLLRWIQDKSDPPARWEQLAASSRRPVGFWYRESPRKLIAEGFTRQVTMHDPPPDVSGMASVLLDAEGRLLRMRVDTPQMIADAGEPAVEPDWAPLLKNAGMDPGALAAAAPRWTPPVYADRRAAFEGAFEEDPNVTARVEAASFAGKPVYFEIVGPWSKPGRDLPAANRTGLRVGEAFVVLIFLGVIVAAILMARRNIRAGSGDRRGGLRVAFYVMALAAPSLLIAAHHIADFGAEWTTFVYATSFSLFNAGLIWLLYMALEPLVRRRWPEGIVAWTRLLAGGVRNPLVGRDVLVGCVAGALLDLIGRLHRIAPAILGVNGPPPMREPVEALEGMRMMIASVLDSHRSALTSAFLLMFLFFLGRMHGRKWQYSLIFFAIYTMISSLSMEGDVPLRVAASLAAAGILTALFAQFGLLAVVTAATVGNFGVPMSFDLSRWYAGVTLMFWLALIAVAAYASWVSLGDRRTITRGQPT